MNLRWLLFITLALLLTAILYYSALRTITFAAVGDLRAILGIISGFIGLIMIFIFPKISTRVSVITILLISLAVRLAVIPADTSDDVNRYLWEGKLYSQGISPYGDNAYHERFQPYQDQFWEKMNHRDKLTAYPPLAVRIFSIINKFSYTHLSYKVAFLTLDLFLIALLLATLYQYQRPLHWSLFYALSPISILSFAGEAHFDIIMVFFVAVSIFAFSKKWFILCGAAMGLAIASKIMVVILAPILLLRTGPKGIIAGIVACILPYALHFEDSFQMYQGLVNFGAKNNFNGLFNQIVVHSIRIPSVATKICGGIFLLSWGIGFWFAAKKRLWPSIYFSLGGLILFAPIVHFWYFSWILLFIALRPSLSWVSFSISVPLYFLVHSNYGRTGNWELPVWARILFYLPFVIFSLIYAKQFILITLSQLRTRRVSPPKGSKELTWSIILPNYQNNDHVGRVIKNLEQLTVPPNEVIITSTNLDGKLQSESFLITSLCSGQEKSQLITPAVEASTQDWCLILQEGDSLKPNNLEKLNKAIRNNSDIIGGTLGHHFLQKSQQSLLTEVISEFRALFMQPCPVEQSQFFHRLTAMQKNVTTGREINYLLKTHGEILTL